MAASPHDPTGRDEASIDGAAPAPGPKMPDRRAFAVRHGAGLAAGATMLLLLIAVAPFVPRKLLEPVPPPPAHWFDDRAKLVAPGFASGKSTYLQQYLPLIVHASVLIVTEPKAPSGAVEEYTARVANAWKVGAQRADNGMALFVFRDERIARLEVGYGLEGSLPDVEAKRLREATLVPQFAQGHYEEGFEDFLSGVAAKLKAYSEETDRVSTATGVIEYAWAVLRQTPRVLNAAWVEFMQSDLTARFMLAIFAAIFAAIFGYALTGVVLGLWALVQVPWRIAAGSAVRAVSRERLAAEFAPAALVREPPASLVAVVKELDIAAIAMGGLSLAGIVVLVAFLGVGTEVFTGERGQFSGAGVTIVWPPR